MPGSMITLFIYHLQMPNGKQRPVGFLKTMNSHVWDGLHLYISSKLKSFFSFEKRYTMTNLGLVGYNKIFLYASVGAPGNAHDTGLLKESSIFHKILKGDALPDRVISLEDFGYVPLVKVGNSAFLQLSWLIKGAMKIRVTSSNDILVKGYVEQELLPKMHMEY